jgi:hypothetical protein
METEEMGATVMVTVMAVMVVTQALAAMVTVGMEVVGAKMEVMEVVEVMAMVLVTEEMEAMQGLAV